ncbi:CHAT domain-containing protein [Saprospira sp. CCB-QB6]|uniref:CHAT domain-containing protein n=1 Tax=Saprospira sp. CCB-QB6 TaxID=3023936 RepID=UPI00234A4CFD|nr:CHAT domain-containing tetratricopeptide repeat protein [Saprospira sp. CCB-QB6]WCL81344.1 CHAT domain-containing protein [Saprospira sp. CCB-QB6]
MKTLFSLVFLIPLSLFAQISDQPFEEMAQKGEYDKMIQLAQKQLKTPKISAREKARLRFFLAWGLDEGKGEDSLALKEYLAAEQWQKEQPQALKDYAKTLELLGNFYIQKRSEFGQALPRLQALKQAYVELQESDSLSIDNDFNIAYCFRMLEKGEESSRIYNSLVQKLSGLPKAERSILPRVYKELANLALEKDELDQALLLFQRALLSAKETFGEKSIAYASQLNSLATYYYRLELYDEAEPLLLEALKIYKTQNIQDKRYAAALGNLGALYIELDRLHDALPLMQEAAEIEKALLGEQNIDYATSLNNIGAVYMRLGNFEKSLAAIQQSVAIIKKTKGSSHGSYVNNLSNLAYVYTVAKKYELADAAYQEVLEWVRKNRGDRSLTYARILYDYAILWEAKGDVDRAIAINRDILSIQETVLGPDSPKLLRSKNSLAIYLFAAQQDEEALAYIDQVVRHCTNKSVGLKDEAQWQQQILEHAPLINTDLLKSLELYYTYLQRTQPSNYQKRLDQIEQTAISLLENERKNMSAEADKLQSLKTQQKWVVRASEQAMTEKDWARAFSYSDFNKTVLLRQHLAQKAGRSLSNLPKEWQEKQRQLEDNWKSIRIAADKTFDAKQKDSLLIAANEAKLQLEELRLDLNQKYPQAAQLEEINWLDKTKLQAELQEGEAILNYLVQPSKIYIFLLPKKGNLVAKTIPIELDQLNKSINNFRKSLSDYPFIQSDSAQARALFLKEGQALYQQLVAPVLAQQKGIQQLLIIPDAALAHIPFEALLNKAPKANSSYAELPYLIKDYAIYYNYSLALWQENNQQKPQNNGQFLGVAASYEGQTNQAGALRSMQEQRLRSHLSPLPAARQEIDFLAQEFSGQFLYDSLANEANFKRLAPNFAVIHLAMHGLLRPRQPLLSALAFSENYDSIENNFLEAHEIAKMNLQADLLVLSACETGLGKFQEGNGIASLARSFMYAKVPALLVSLWQVNDLSTAYLMQEYYKNLAAGNSKSQALQQAKLNYLQHAEGLAQHPAFWAAFIQLGNDKPLQLQPDFWSSKLILLATIFSSGLSILILLYIVLRWKKKDQKAGLYQK